MTGAVRTADPTPGASSGASLGAQVRSGVRWSFLNTVVARGLTFASGVALARLLVPADFGVYAVAFVILSGLISMNELGVSLAIVRWPGDVRQIAPTVATIATVSSTTLYVGIFALAPLLASALGAPQAAPIIRVLCLVVVVDGVVAVSAAVIQRDFRQDHRFVADVVNTGVGAIVSVGLALGGAGAWSLAYGRLAGSLLSAVVLIRWASLPLRLGFDRGRARELVRFGMPLAVSSMVLFGVMNVDYAIVGSRLGPDLLGLYLLAFNLSSWSVVAFSTVARSVALPGFARLQHDPEQLSQSFARSLSLLLAATGPVGALLLVFAQPVIGFVYGSQWVAAATALALLATVGTVRALLELGYDLLVAVGSTRLVLALQLLWFVALLPAMVVGVRWGLPGVAAAHLVVAVVVITPAYLATIRSVGVRLTPMARECVRPAVGIALLLAIALSARDFVGSSVVLLAGVSAVGLAAHLAVVSGMRRPAHVDNAPVEMVAA